MDVLCESFKSLPLSSQGYYAWLCVFACDGSEGFTICDTFMLGSDPVLCWLIDLRDSLTVAACWPWREGNLFLSLSVSPSGAFSFSSFFEEVKREMYDLTRESQEPSGTWPHLQRVVPKTYQQLVMLWESLSFLNWSLHAVTSGLK